MRYLLACLCLGAIGYFGSEALFWTAPPDDLSLPTLVATIAIYALAGSVGLSAVLVTGCSGWPGLFLGGALMGMSVEGAVVSTMYDAFPLQLVWTPLAWHALLTAGVVFGLARRLAGGPVWRQIGAMLVLGLAFGLWGGYWPTERTGLVLDDAGSTGGYLCGSGLLALIGQAGLDRIGPLTRPRRAVLLAGPVAVALLWGIGSVLAPSPLRLAGPVMAGLTFWAMWRLGRRPARPLRLAPAPVWRHALVLVLPVTTTLVAAGLWHLAGPLPSNIPIALGSGLVALVLWAALLGRAYRSAASASPKSSAPS